MTANDSVSNLLSRIPRDPWRDKVPFTPDLLKAQSVILESPFDESRSVSALREWIGKYQPCLFGRAAARFGTLSTRVYDESFLNLTDAQIQRELLRSRLEWIRETWKGESSGVVLLFSGPRLACARSGAEVFRLSARLTSLFLQCDVHADTVYHADAYLSAPGEPPMAWRWLAGVNYFSSGGDGRWWHDHRIPGGIALSINSVGHLVKSGKLAAALRTMRDSLGGDCIDDPEADPQWMDRLEKALRWAMLTIDGAAETRWGKTTRLVSLDAETERRVGKCPIELAGNLVGRDYSKYEGYYHTDQTLPSEYFREGAERPATAAVYELDLSYLFHRDVENPDHDLIGEGRRIRAEGVGAVTPVRGARLDEKLRRAACDLVRVADYPLLAMALASA